MKSKIKILIFENKNQAAKFAADLIASEISDPENMKFSGPSTLKNRKRVAGKKKFNLCLAAGETMIPVYHELVKLHKEKKINFQNITTFNIDEYIGAKKENSFKYFLENNFLSFVNIKKENQHFLNENNFVKYEDEIKKDGGIDFLLLGIGQNGHIAFNEPQSNFKSRTRKINLHEETRRVNKKDFRNFNDVPKQAVTVGIGTILQARKIILIAFGKEKAQELYSSACEKSRVQCPASALQLHRDVTFIVDKVAASKLIQERNLARNTKLKYLRFDF